MIDITYHYFFFKPIPYEYVVFKLGDRYETGFLRQGYAKWAEWFAFHTRLFYYDQTYQHEQMIYQAFIREHDLPDDGGESVGESPELDRLYIQALIQNGYTQHYAAYERFMAYVGEYIRPYEGRVIISSNDAFSEFVRELTSTRPIPRSLINPITRLWFNTLIDNPHDEINRLRKMPYGEYLRTEHWYRVRALTLFVYRALCASIECRGWSDQMWIAYAHHRHVHHLSYKNRGNERYGDVCVLCDKCHTKVHSGKPELIDELATYIVF